MGKNNFKILWSYLKNEKIRLFIYIFLIFMSYIPTLGAAFFWGKALEYLVIGDFSNFLLSLSIWSAIYIIFYSLLSIPREYIYNYLEIKFNKNVIKDLYKKVVDLPCVAFEQIGVGEFINRISSDPERVIELLSKLIRMICKSLVVLVCIIIAFMSSTLVGIEILIFAIIMGFISYNYFPKIRATQERIKKKSDKYVKEATENITGIREIKALGIKNNIENRTFSNIDELFEDNRKIRKYEINYNNINNLIYYILQYIILLSCGYFVIIGEMAYATAIIISNYIWRIDEVVESISDFGVSYNKVKVSLKRIDEIINNRLYNDEKFGELNLENVEGTIEFKDVSFRYRDDENNTLNNLNLKIEPNKKIAIVGRSGNGKSTIFNLLLRFFDPNSGIITIDGVDIKTLTEESLRNNIAIIRQSPFLFNLSIIDNFRLIKSDVTLQEIKNVCRDAYIDEYIESLPKKYETIIGEGGINLSGGQKQRLAIARTLLLNTKVILFDEATSALDNESQEYIKKTIDNIVKDHTVVIIAHRLSTIIDSDIINVIDKGKLVSSGSHSDLLKKSSVYRKLYYKDNGE